MALPTFQAVGTPAEAADATATPTWPTHQADDIGLLVIESWNASPATPTGWAHVTGSPQTHSSGTESTQLNVFWKRAAGASEANPTIEALGQHTYAVIVTFRGCIASGNPWDVTSGGVKSSASTTTTWNTITTTVADCLVVLLASRENDSAAAAWSAFVNAALANFAERHDAGTALGHGGGLVVETAEKAAAGAVGTTTATVTSSRNCHLVVALKPPVTTQNLTPSLVTDAETFFAPTVSASNALAPALVTDAETFFAPTVSPGAVAISPALFTDSDTFFAPVVTAGETLLPGLFSDADVFFAPAVTASSALEPSLFTDSEAFFAPGVVATNEILPGLYSDADVFFAPTVTQDQVLSPSLYVDTDVFFAPGIVIAGSMRARVSIEPYFRGSVAIDPAMRGHVEIDTQ